MAAPVPDAPQLWWCYPPPAEGFRPRCVPSGGWSRPRLQGGLNGGDRRQQPALDGSVAASEQTVAAAVAQRTLEGEFVAVAGNYPLRRGISYAAWREAGVDAALLRKAGISR